MSVNPNLLRVFFRGSEQRIKVFDGTPESSILNSIKKAFHIIENDSKIYLQDEEGDMIVLPPSIPNGLCVHVFIEPSILPSASINSTNNPHQNLLPGFKWQSLSQDNGVTIKNDGYTISQDKDDRCPIPAVSTETYNSGRIFIKMNVRMTFYQSFGFVEESYKGDPVYVCNTDTLPYINPYYFADLNGFESVGTFAVYADFDKRIAKFYWFVDNKIKKTSNERALPKGPIKFFGWVKHFEMTIMEGGSSPIPDFV